MIATFGNVGTAMLKQIENDKVLVLLNIIRGSSGGPETHSGIGMVYAAIFVAQT